MRIHIKKILISVILTMAVFNGLVISASSKSDINLNYLNKAKIANAEGIEGIWIVTFYTPKIWRCFPDGGVCCPEDDCE